MTEQEWRWIFSKRLRYHLDKIHMTQKELAEAIDISEVAISWYMNAKRSPKISTIIKMANALGCRVGDLVDVGEMIELD